MTTIHLTHSMFSDTARLLLDADGMQAWLFRYATGIEAVRLCNRRGEVIVLPYLGQIVWSARFDGVGLGMGSPFEMPRPAATIVDTYGCLAFHSGLLRNGCPGPGDDHALHGEFAVAPMDSAALVVEADGITLTGSYRYLRGFGDHYVATPSVTLAADAARIDIAMNVTNRGGKPLDLMYMCHVNFAFVPDGRIVQPAPFTPQAMTVRTALPAHVPSNPAYEARLRTLAADPAATRILSDDLVLDPEFVGYLNDIGTDDDGRTHLMLRRPEGDGFSIAYEPRRFPHTVRWLLRDPDMQVAAFALPSTCHPEGYLAERRKGHVQSVAPGETVGFAVELGYVDVVEAAALETTIESLGRVAEPA
jgi:hypothetical protein